MKYNTFRNILWVVGAVVGVVVISYSCGSSPSSANNSSNKPKAFTNTAPKSTNTAQEIMKAFESSSDGRPKLKDAFPGSATKVNMYDDTATGKWTRAKIDYDRDEKDDEKWERDLATGQITRVISTNDDGAYGPTQTWNGSSFVEASANIPNVDASPTANTKNLPANKNAPLVVVTRSGALLTQDIMKVFEGSPGGQPKLKDAFPGSATKVNMYDDTATGKWTRAKIDYDRDEKDDEKWERDLATGQITRMISTNDDGAYGSKQTWNGSSFVQ